MTAQTHRWILVLIAHRSVCCLLRCLLQQEEGAEQQRRRLLGATGGGHPSNLFSLIGSYNYLTVIPCYTHLHNVARNDAGTENNRELLGARSPLPSIANALLGGENEQQFNQPYCLKHQSCQQT